VAVANGDSIKQMAMRKYVVFNLDQMTGLPDGLIPEDEEPDWETRYLAAKLFTDRMTCPVKHGNIDKAYYIPSKHFIHMPQRKTFKGEGEYYATLFHEQVHSTGKDLERDMTGDMGTDRYAKEELVAEIGSAILCAQFGIAAPVQHPEYIHGYIKQLEDHDRAFWQAATKAQRAVELLTNQKEAA
jgi:antirestriction protein ArdC